MVKIKNAPGIPKQPGDGQKTAAKTYKEERHVTREENDLMWCVLSMEEYAKCRHFAEQVSSLFKLSSWFSNIAHFSPDGESGDNSSK